MCGDRSVAVGWQRSILSPYAADCGDLIPSSLIQSRHSLPVTSRRSIQSVPSAISRWYRRGFLDDVRSRSLCLPTVARVDSQLHYARSFARRKSWFPPNPTNAKNAGDATAATTAAIARSVNCVRCVRCVEWKLVAPVYWKLSFSR